MNWRSIGDTTLVAWMQTLSGTPIARDPLERTYEAARPHTKLCLAQAKRESDLGRGGIATDRGHNPLGLRPRGGPGFQRFATWTDAIAEWKARITDPGYAYVHTTTLEDYVHIYAPNSDGNDERAYVAFVTAYVAALPSISAGGTPPVALNMMKGLIPLPPIRTHLVTPQQRPEGVGWDDLGKRTVKGVVLHRMQGSLGSTDNYFHRADTRALTDYGIDNLTGEMIQWADPNGRMSGWASGKVSTPYGDGKAFVDKYGIDAVNRDQVSLEFGGWFLQPGAPSREEPVNPVAYERAALFIAHFAHDYGIPWDSFPIAPQDGFSFIRWHEEFTFGTGKVCPGQTIKAATDDLIARAKAIMRTYQVGGVPLPPPSPPSPSPPEDFGIDGLDLALAKARFGKKVYQGVTYEFTPGAPISELWLARARAEGVFPKLTKVERFNPRMYWTFDGGWVAWRPNDQASVRVQKGKE